jgi:SAM-dependent methyltransferase
MHWKLKALIQQAVALLPPDASYELYYRMQKRFGALKDGTPIDRLQAGVTTWKHIQDQRRNPVGAVFFEVGTGSDPIVPLAYWLMGAKRTVTVDLNRYLRADAVQDTLEYIERHPDEIRAIFGPLLLEDRFATLPQLSRSFSLERFLDVCGIHYTAPGDAGRTPVDAASIDFHTSYTVLEHIPPDVLARILEEGNRIVRDDGLFVHLIDYSDHFSHSDKSISPLNFLQYSDAQWRALAGNRYNYTNRLRHDDVIAIFQSAGHEIRADRPAVNRTFGQLVADGRLTVDPRFAKKSLDVLSTWSAWIVSQKRLDGRPERSTERSTEL